MIKWAKKRWIFVKRIPFILKRKEFDSGRILIIQTCALGDAAILVPFVKKIVDAGYKVTLAAKPAISDFWQLLLPDIDVIRLDYNNRPQNEVEEFLKRFENEEYEAVFGITSSPETAMLAAYCQSKHCYGMIESAHYFRGSFISFRKLYNAGKFEHFNSRLKNLFNLYFKDIDFDNLEKLYSESSPNLKKSVILHVGAKWKPRRWDKEKFLAVAKYLHSKDCEVRIIAGAEETDLLDYFRAEFPEGINYSPDSIANLVDAIKSCDMIIGNDSGPVHVGNLFGKRTIVLWGPGNDKRIRPIGENVTIVMLDMPCRPCKQYKHPETCEMGINNCLKNISAESLIELLEKE